MKIWYCEDCGGTCTYNELEKGTYNYVPYGMTEVLESIAPKCPHCGSEDISEVDAIYCDRCGDIIPEDLAKLNEATDEYLCDICYDEVHGK